MKKECYFVEDDEQKIKSEKNSKHNLLDFRQNCKYKWSYLNMNNKVC
jgi:hypothetical protein